VCAQGEDNKWSSLINSCRKQIAKKPTQATIWHCYVSVFCVTVNITKKRNQYSTPSQSIVKSSKTRVNAWQWYVYTRVSLWQNMRVDASQIVQNMRVHTGFIVSYACTRKIFSMKLACQCVSPHACARAISFYKCTQKGEKKKQRIRRQKLSGVACMYTHGR